MQVSCGRVCSHPTQRTMRNVVVDASQSHRATFLVDRSCPLSLSLRELLGQRVLASQIIQMVPVVHFRDKQRSKAAFANQ